MLLSVMVALVLCVLEITALVVASPMMKPSFLLSFLPEDVRLAAKDHPEPPKSKQILAYLIFAVFIIAMIGGIIFIGMDGVRSGCGFWQLTLRFLVVLYINKAFDILVQDQWLVMTVGFYKKIFPETAGCEGWKNRGFNNKKQIVRIIAYPFLCMMTAGIFMLL